MFHFQNLYISRVLAVRMLTSNERTTPLYSENGNVCIYMGVSTRNHQIHPVNLFKFDESFTVDRALFSDHFGKKSLNLVPIFPAKNAKYVFWLLSLFRKNNFSLSKNSMFLYENSIKVYIIGNILNPHVKLHQNPSTKKLKKLFFRHSCSHRSSAPCWKNNRKSWMNGNFCSGGLVPLPIEYNMHRFVFAPT